MTRFWHAAHRLSTGTTFRRDKDCDKLSETLQSLSTLVSISLTKDPAEIIAPEGHSHGLRVRIGNLFYQSRRFHSLMQTLKYLTGYPESLQAQVRALIDSDRLGTLLATKYGEVHAIRNDRQLYDYVQEMKSRHLRKSVPLGKVQYDGKLQVVKHALGTHTAISRSHGGQLKASREIRIASVFRDAPAPFLKMIVVHELAHIKQPDHDKAFYQLCTNMAPDYHQLELDMRLWLTHREIRNASPLQE